MSTVEAVLTVPVLVAMVLAIVQAALWWYAHQVAATAAEEAARTARAYATSNAQAAAAGQTRGNAYLGTVDPDSSTLRTRHITVTRTATTVTVRVTGQVVSIVPFLSPNVDVSVTAPIERYVPNG